MSVPVKWGREEDFADDPRRYVHAGESTLCNKDAGPSGITTPASGGYPHARTLRMPPKNWPTPLRREAFHGPAGELARLIDPHTESEVAAILIQSLVLFGNMIGRNAYFLVGATRHHMNLYATLAGDTSKGRKGTSLDHVMSLLGEIDPDWASSRRLSGLSSGEGLIWQVRDPSKDDEGEPDKRLLIVEPEFAKVLQVCEREANTLSALIREGWDRGDLATLTKGNSLKARGAHISIVAHITVDELRRRLKDTAVANGFANRFLWVCVRRSKLLPDGGALHTVDFAALLGRLKEALEFGRTAGELNRDDDARAIWHRAYGPLSDGRPGLFGAAVGRAEAQAARLSCIFALLDCSKVIRAQHLKAALAVWEYCENSARFIFGSALGDSAADDILNELHGRPDGMTRTEIREYFHKHKSSEELDRALALLAEHGLAVRVREPTAGRPADRWRATSYAATDGAESPALLTT